MKFLSRSALTVFLMLLPLVQGCDKNGDFVPLFSVEDDKKLGRQLKQKIENSPNEYPLLDSTKNNHDQAYAHIRGIVDKILNSGEVTYKDEFNWETYIIRDDSTLNAFAAPGGYIYVYTGLIKYLDREDHLAGVLAHEVAHADQRHSVKQMQQQYGVQLLLSIALGENPSKLTEILAGLAGKTTMLKFSRNMESEADEFSVEYLAPTEYQCNGAAAFFEKMTNNGGGSSVPEFFSTHPDPGDRVKAINNKADEIGCSTTPSDSTKSPTYQEFKNMLPE